MPQREKSSSSMKRDAWRSRFKDSALNTSAKTRRARRSPIPTTGSTSSDRNATTGEVQLLDEAGRVAIEIQGLRFEHLSEDAPRAAVANPDDWLYEFRSECHNGRSPAPR